MVVSILVLLSKILHAIRILTILSTPEQRINHVMVVLIFST